MTDQAERYDRIAAGYERWWAPVLAPRPRGTARLASRGGRSGADRPRRCRSRYRQPRSRRDRRWPVCGSTGVDASSEMIAVAVDEADRALAGPDGPVPVRRGVGRRDAVPRFIVRSRDLVLRPPARPAPGAGAARGPARAAAGWPLAFVTWLVDARAFPPDRVFDAVLDDLGFGARHLRRPIRRSAVPRACGLRVAAGRLLGVSALHGSIAHRFGVETTSRSCAIRRGDAVRPPG